MSTYSQWIGETKINYKRGKVFQRRGNWICPNLSKYKIQFVTEQCRDQDAAMLFARNKFIFENF